MDGRSRGRGRGRGRPRVDLSQIWRDMSDDELAPSEVAPVQRTRLQISQAANAAKKRKPQERESIEHDAKLAEVRREVHARNPP